MKLAVVNVGVKCDTVVPMLSLQWRGMRWHQGDRDLWGRRLHTRGEGRVGGSEVAGGNMCVGEMYLLEPVAKDNHLTSHFFISMKK